MDGDTSLAASVLVVGTFIGILKSPPSTDVINQDRVEPRVTALDIGKKLCECVPPLDPQATLSSVRVCLDDFHVVQLCVTPDGIGLVLGRVILMLCGHPNVFGGPDLPGFRVVSDLPSSA